MTAETTETVQAVKAEDAVREEIRLYLENLLGLLVDDKKNLSVTFWRGEQTTVFQVKINKEQLGQLIGKKGRTISAIRELMKVVTGRLKIRAIVDLQE